MARSRNIKPGFWKNEALAECTSWARLCFAGLWTLADREGRLLDRPKRIKGELFAFDSIEVDPLLDELQKHGFIRRYVVDGVAVIQILNFLKHQNPHYKEAPSVLPPPPESPGLSGGSSPPEPSNAQASIPWNEPDAPDPPGASPGQASGSSLDERGANRADSGFLIPDSLIPDSLQGAPETSPPMTRAGAICRALRRAGIPGVSPSHPRLLALLAAGATDGEFVDAANKAVGKSDGFAYVLGVVEGRRRDAAKVMNGGVHHGPMPRNETAGQRAARERVEAAVPNLAPKPARSNDPEVVDVAAKRVG